MSLVACGDDGGGGSCESICLAAQDLNCTSINDCYEFCDVTLRLSGKADCAAEYNAFHSCSQSTPTCSIGNQCALQKNALTACIYPFCAANPTDSDCIAAQNL
jgi:hypothetical protein